MKQVGEWRILANLAYRALFVPVPAPLLLRTTGRIDELHRKSLARKDSCRRLPPPNPADATRRIRIAYMTPNFTDHPVGHVTLKLFPLHDRERFEVHAISTQGRRGGDPNYNKRHRHGVDFYHEFGDLPHVDMARRIRNLGIDILIDLDGYMETASTAVMVFRPCPIQVYWLGHAGGLGLSFVDYLIADDIVIPEGEENLYRETIARLPECYHVASPATIAENAAEPRGMRPAGRCLRLLCLQQSGEIQPPGLRSLDEDHGGRTQQRALGFQGQGRAGAAGHAAPAGREARRFRRSDRLRRPAAQQGRPLCPPSAYRPVPRYPDA